MSHTNSTTHYNLPQFLTSDKPAWLTDINNAFLDIDTGLNTAQSAATTAGNNATQALSDASAAATAASTADAKGAGAVASIEANFDPTTIYAIGAKVMYNSLLYRCHTAVVTPGPWTGAANWERITVDSIIPNNSNELPYITGGTSGTVGYELDNLIYASTVLTPTYTISKSSGAWTIGSVYAKKYGRIIHLQITVEGNGAQVTAGSNGFVGTITSGDLPYFVTSNTNYYMSSGIVVQVESDGTIIFRVLANNLTLGVGNSTTLSLMFITSE